MAVYFITGKLGAGKTLASVGRLKTYLEEGRKVATNLDLKLEYLLPSNSKQTVLRLPDKPRLEDMKAMGFGSNNPDKYDESKFGVLVLDELASWFNTRSFQDKERAPLIEWFLHARKYHWDIFFIVQDANAVDKQLRDALGEHLVSCKRTDRYSIPFIGFIYKLATGKKLTAPRFHLGIVRYGMSETSVVVDRWWYRGTEIQKGYFTGQVFTDDALFDYSGDGVSVVDMRASYTMLSPWHLKGRYQIKSVSLFTKIKIFFGSMPTRSSGASRQKIIKPKNYVYVSKLVRTITDGKKPVIDMCYPWPLIS